jgi:hypothetical protein
MSQLTHGRSHYPAPADPETNAEPMSAGDGFEIETLINLGVAHARAMITDVGSVERRRVHGVSRLNAVSDGIRILHTIFAECLRTRRISSDTVADKPRADVTLIGEST